MHSSLGPQQGLRVVPRMKRKSSNARVRSEDSWSEGNRNVPEEWQEVNLAERKSGWDSHSHPWAQIPGSQGSP